MRNNNLGATASRQPALVASLPEPVPVSALPGDGQAHCRCAELRDLLLEAEIFVQAMDEDALGYGKYEDGYGGLVRYPIRDEWLERVRKTMSLTRRFPLGMTDFMVPPESIPDDLGKGDPLVDPLASVDTHPEGHDREAGHGS